MSSVPGGGGGGAGGAGGGGKIEAQSIQFLFELRENLSKQLQSLDKLMSQKAGTIEGSLRKMAGASEVASTKMEEDWADVTGVFETIGDEVPKHTRRAAQGIEDFADDTSEAAQKIQKQVAEIVDNFSDFGNSTEEAVGNLGKALEAVGGSAQHAERIYQQSFTRMAEPTPFRKIKQQADAMGHQIAKVLRDTSAEGKVHADKFLKMNEEMIRHSIEEFKRYGKEVPKQLQIVEAQIDKMRAGQKSKLMKLEDLFANIKGINVGDSVIGGMAMAASHSMRNRAEETYETARDASKISAGGTSLTKKRETEISDARIATGANIEQLGTINREYAKMAHLGPSAFDETAKSTMHLSRVTDMSTEQAAKFTVQLRQMYQMSGVAASAAEQKIVALSKSSGVSAESFAEIYDSLKFTRFALDGNVLSAQKLAAATAEAAAKMGRYGISAKDVLDDVSKATAGGMDTYVQDVQNLVEGGLSVAGAEKLLNDRLNNVAGAQEKINATIGAGYDKRIKGAKTAAERAGVNQIYIDRGMDVGHLQKQAAFSRGDIPAGAVDDVATANVEQRSVGETTAQAAEVAAGVIAKSQQKVYELQRDAATQMYGAAQTFATGVQDFLGSGGLQTLGGVARVGAKAVEYGMMYKIAKQVFGWGKGAKGVAGVAEAATAGGSAATGAATAAETVAVANTAGKTAVVAVESTATAGKLAQVAAWATKTMPVLGKVATVLNNPVFKMGAKVLGAVGVGWELGQAVKKLMVAAGDTLDAESDAYDADAQAKYQTLQLYKKQLEKAEAMGDTDKVKKIRERMHKDYGISLVSRTVATAAADGAAKPGSVAKEVSAATAEALRKDGMTETKGAETDVTKQAEAQVDSADNIQKAFRAAEQYAYGIQSAIYGIAARLKNSSGTAPASYSPPGSAGQTGGAGGGSARPGTSVLATAIAKQEGWYAKGKSPNQGQRNNNPGNMRVGMEDWRSDPAKAQRIAEKQGAIGYDPKTGFLKFASPEAGWKGLDRQLGFYADRGMSVDSMVETYAPSKDNNNVQAYKGSLAKSGFAPQMSVAEALKQRTEAPADTITPPAAKVNSGMQLASAHVTTPGLSQTLKSTMPSPQQRAESRVQLAQAPTTEPFTGATKGDTAVVAELRRATALLASIAAATRQQGPVPMQRSEFMEELITGGMG